jgi:hypothetical protein
VLQGFNILSILQFGAVGNKLMIWVNL